MWPLCCCNWVCTCSVCFLCVCVGSNSHTQEEALFPLSNDNRACVAMATGCSFYGLCVCVCVCAHAPYSLFVHVHCLLGAWCNTRIVIRVSPSFFSLFLTCNSEICIGHWSILSFIHSFLLTYFLFCDHVCMHICVSVCLSLILTSGFNHAVASWATWGWGLLGLS